MLTRLFRRLLIRLAAVLVVLAGGVGLYWFQPWKLVTDREVGETLASVPVPASPAASAAVPAGPVVARQGEFISHEHETSGVARVIENPDGTRQLELVGLDTSNGPDLRVWLSDQPVRAGAAGWHLFDDGAWIELGRLKGNRGDQAYPIPADADLDRLRSVSVWCKRFSVSFGAARLTPAA